jgi:magnesium transporter
MLEANMAEIENIDIDQVLEQVRSALSEGNWDQVIALLEPLRPPDQATLFEDLDPEEQIDLLPRLHPRESADILEELEEQKAAEIATQLETQNLAKIVDYMEPDEAADLLKDISPEQAKQVLAEISEPSEVIPLLSYPDDSAGGMMTSVEFDLQADMTVEQAIDYLRTKSPDEEQIYYLFVVDSSDHLVGVVSLRQLVISKPGTKIRDIMNTDVISIAAGTDREEAARLMTRYDLLALPVVDEKQCLVGMITYDDSFDVLEDEATEDIYRLGGVPEGAVTDIKISVVMRGRLPWLALNLVTAMASATVLSVFQSTIARAAVLAAFFPIVAGVTGSAATQTLTVTVRGLALGEINIAEALPVLGREILIGLLNGLSIGGLVAIIAILWKGPPILGAIVGVATLLNMLTAGFAGVLVPIIIERLKIDPALASPILVTTTTDTLGYLIYLGLATALISLLV